MACAVAREHVFPARNDVFPEQLQTPRPATERTLDPLRLWRRRIGRLQQAFGEQFVDEPQEVTPQDRRLHVVLGLHQIERVAECPDRENGTPHVGADLVEPEVDAALQIEQDRLASSSRVMTASGTTA